MARSSRRTVPLSAGALSKRLAGRVVMGLEEDPSGSSVIRFEDGGHLVIEQGARGVGFVLHEKVLPVEKAGSRPTRRQLDYLEFIRRYMHRNGVSPAEADIQAHFLVSAPSVNQMIRTLEKRGFVCRDRDWFGQTVPRSIRVLWDE
jgi:LexA DNA binding domain